MPGDIFSSIDKLKEKRGKKILKMNFQGHLKIRQSWIIHDLQPCACTNTPPLALVELLADVSPASVEEFKLCLEPRGIVWCAQLAYVLSCRVHSAHHHFLDRYGLCQVLHTHTDTHSGGLYYNI